MKNLYHEFFHIPKDGKIREKVMLTRVTMTVAVVIVCLIAMSITAYAYFSYNITSGASTIQAATFETKVSVQITDGNGKAISVITSNYKSHLAELKANTEYYITLKHTDRSTAKTGFVIVTAENCSSRYHTQQLGRDGNENTETVTFWLKPNADTKVTFLSHWGTSSFYSDFKEIGENSELYIINGERIALSITGATNNSQNPDETTPTETTVPDETTASTEATTAPTEETTPATQSTTEATEPVTESTTEATEPVTESTTEVTEPVTESTTEATEPVTESTTEATEPVTESTTEATQPVTESTTEATEPVTESTTEATEPVTESTTEATEPVTEGTTEATEPVTESTLAKENE